MKIEQNPENNIEVDESLDALKKGIQKPAIEKKSDQFYDDMEWSLLVGIMRDPKIMNEIYGIIGDPKLLIGVTDDTPHSLIYQALTNLWDDGVDPQFERLYAECEKIRESNPMISSYSRAAIMELDFQATIRVDRDVDENRIRAKFCAEQVLRRK